MEANGQKQIPFYGGDFVRDRRGSEVARTAAVGHPLGKARRGRPRGTGTKFYSGSTKAGHQQSPGGLPATVVRVRQVRSGSVTG